MKDRRLTPKQIDRLLANNSHKIELNIQEQPVAQKTVSFTSESKEYDTLNSEDAVKTFCEFIRTVISRYEENQRRQSEAETMELDIEHCIELAPKLTEKEKKMLYSKLTEVLQERRACKSENEILQPLYSYFVDKTLLNKLSQLQGTVSNIKDIISNRQYACRTNILDDFRINSTLADAR